MHSQLRERIRLMRARLDNAAPVAEIRAESQVFVTPAPVCDRLVTLAEISNRDHILEPSAGTGAILRAFSLLRPGGVLVAVCLNGPRQQEKLLPFSDVREELPRGTFAYTSVPTMIIRLRA
ncbi:hypothetical protein [Escherichia coli]|uniref:hypothetical protein n=1 Tax=Escherichia coli TaxID=562 RepID=UPI001F314D9A|nr:hypothetical protein [Escherichia coli]